MSQRLDNAAVRQIAALARLELSEAEVELFSKQLADILAYVGELNEVETTGIPPTSHPHPIAGEWRPDKIQPCLDRDGVLAAAPEASQSAGLFKVPKVL